MSTRPRGYGITQQDMEASRLVFVSVKDAKPRRKVAVPVPDSYTWEQFVQQVQSKLKIAGVESIYLASSGEKVTKLDELQDIDELHVIEGKPPASSSPITANGPVSDRTTSGSAASTSAAANGRADGQSLSPQGRAQSIQPHPVPPLDLEIKPREGADEQKYVRRTGNVRRSLQRVLPAIFSPGLPVTTRDVQEDGRKGPRRRRRRDSIFAPRNLLSFAGLVIFVLCLLWIYSRMVPQLE